MTCGECKARAAMKSKRGLCWRCYHTPGVRARHPVTSKYAPAKYRYGYADHEPTQAEVDRMVAEQMANLPSWWHQSVANEAEYGAGGKRRKPRQADPPRLPRRCRRAGKR